jgi:hypothetical protein
MKALPLILILIFGLCIAECGPKQGDSGIGVSVNPGQPIFIPWGTLPAPVGPGGYFQLAPPYFSANSIIINWTGTNTLQLLAVLITTVDPNATIPVTCALAGLDLTTIFAAQANPVTGNVNIPPGTTATSAAWGCGSITVPTPLPNSFNIPINVKVVGIVLDGSGNAIGRVSGSTNITAH